MEIDPEKPGVIGLWKGEGEPEMQWIARIGTVVVAFLFLLGIFLALNIHM